MFFFFSIRKFAENFGTAIEERMLIKSFLFEMRIFSPETGTHIPVHSCVWKKYQLIDFRFITLFSIFTIITYYCYQYYYLYYCVYTWSKILVLVLLSRLKLIKKSLIILRRKRIIIRFTILFKRNMIWKNNSKSDNLV